MLCVWVADNALKFTLEGHVLLRVVVSPVVSAPAGYEMDAAPETGVRRGSGTLWRAAMTRAGSSDTIVVPSNESGEALTHFVDVRFEVRAHE